MQLFKRTSFRFIEKRKIFFGISLTLMVLSVIFIIRGPNFGVDFVGGSLVQINFSRDIPIQNIRMVLGKHNLPKLDIQKFPNTSTVVIKIKSIENIDQKLKDVFTEEFPDNAFVVERKEMVGPVVGEYLKSRAVQAFLLSFAGIIVYVGIRFKGGVWGVAGVLALIHDVTITFGFLCLLHKEITLVIIASLMTLAGYSVNDTIVIYDRIRDNMKLHFKKPLNEIIDMSINDTLSRTIITSFTMMSILITLYLKGGPVMHDFSVSLLFGVVTGTYSSIFIASPMVYMWLAKTKKK